MFCIKSYWKQWRKITGTALIGMLCLILVTAAGAQNVTRAHSKRKALPPVDASKLFWPLPPATPRIRFVAQYFGERDLLGEKLKKPGFLERAAGVAVTNAERPRLRKPYGVAVDSRGLIYTADEGLHRVFVFDLDKRQLTFRGDKRPAQIQLPVGVAIDDKDRLFVSDAVLHRITCFNANGSFASVFGEDNLTLPAGMAVDNDLRRLYVTDVKGSRLAVFDLDTFKFIRYFLAQKPSKEEPSGILATPTNVAVNPDGLIYVVDTILNRVELFDSEGNYLGGFGEQGNTPGKFARPKGIAIDSDGHVYVADDEFNNIQVFTATGHVLMAMGGFGVSPGQFGLLTALTFDSQRNRLIATDGGPYARFEVFRYITDAEVEASEKASRDQGFAGAAAANSEAKEPSK